MAARARARAMAILLEDNRQFCFHSVTQDIDALAVWTRKTDALDVHRANSLAEEARIERAAIDAEGGLRIQLAAIDAERRIERAAIDAEFRAIDAAQREIDAAQRASDATYMCDLSQFIFSKKAAGS